MRIFVLLCKYIIFEFLRKLVLTHTFVYKIFLYTEVYHYSIIGIPFKYLFKNNFFPSTWNVTQLEKVERLIILESKYKLRSVKKFLSRETSINR